MAKYHNCDAPSQHQRDYGTQHNRVMEEEFKDRLKTERERLGLSQLELAQKVDRNKKQSFISNFETGARTATSWIVDLAHALGVDAYWLKTGKGQRTPEPGTALSEDQALIITAFELSSPEQKNEWLMLARMRIEVADQKKQAETPPLKVSNARR